MDFSSLIKILYSDNVANIISVLNDSLYVQDFNDDDNTFIHTGFSYQIQTGKKFNLFFHSSTGKVIRQVFNEDQSLPQLVGLLSLKSESGYIDLCYNMMIAAFDVLSDNYILFKTSDLGAIWGERATSIELINSDGDIIKTESFIFIRESEDSQINIDFAFPLSKELNNSVYFGKNLFLLSPPIMYSRSYEDDEDIRCRNVNEYDDSDYDGHYEYESDYHDSWASQNQGLSDDYIDDVLGGEPDAYWNID